MIARLLIALLRGYKKYISPHLGHHCRFIPTCSEYAMQALAAAAVVQKRMHQGLVVRTHGIERLDNARQLGVLDIVLKAADLVNRQNHAPAASALKNLEYLLAQGP